MRTTMKHPGRPPVPKRRGVDLPDGIGGTIAGGPMLAVDLTSLLRRDSPSMSLGGAVSGAAQIVVSSAGGGSGQEAGVALSDGSRIIFASLGSARMLADA